LEYEGEGGWVWGIELGKVFYLRFVCHWYADSPVGSEMKNVRFHRRREIVRRIDENRDRKI
jgi:hypothetical protein